MPHTKRVGVKDLKNRLSMYLREVRTGGRILVTDRGEVVAELHEARSAADPEEEALTEWLEARDVVSPTREKRPLPAPRVRLPAGTAARVLDELRAPTES